MTHEERIIISAYTGVLMCPWSDLHKFIEDKLGRSVWTHEMADQCIWDELKMAVKDDFLALCEQ